MIDMYADVGPIRETVRVGVQIKPWTPLWQPEREPVVKLADDEPKVVVAAPARSEPATEPAKKCEACGWYCGCHDYGCPVMVKEVAMFVTNPKRLAVIAKYVDAKDRMSPKDSCLASAREYEVAHEKHPGNGFDRVAMHWKLVAEACEEAARQHWRNKT